MDNEKDNTRKRLTFNILAALSCTFAGISLLMSGLGDNSKPTIIVACFILLLDIVIIVSILVDRLRKN